MVREGGGRDPGLWDLILELIRVLLRGCLAACVLQWQVVASCAPGVSAPCGGDGLCECLSGARDVLGIRGITKGLLGTAGKLAGGQKVIGVMEKLHFLCVFLGEEKNSAELEKLQQLLLLCHLGFRGPPYHWAESPEGGFGPQSHFPGAGT